MSVDTTSAHDVDGQLAERTNAETGRTARPTSAGKAWPQGAFYQSTVSASRPLSINTYTSELTAAAATTTTLATPGLHAETTASDRPTDGGRPTLSLCVRRRERNAPRRRPERNAPRRIAAAQVISRRAPSSLSARAHRATANNFSSSAARSTVGRPRPSDRPTDAAKVEARQRRRLRRARRRSATASRRPIMQSAACARQGDD
uniref:Uncharacterized protein n=1 Tax=Plectus sambesii TaxID=2011161 RepID=A0A914UK86_9BILA